MARTINEFVKDVAKIINNAVGGCFIGKYFKLEGSGYDARHGARFLREIWAGLSTFFAMAYIISVNANIMTGCGGPCKCPEGMDCNRIDPPQEYADCLLRIQKEFVTSTAIISAITSIAMGLFSNLPIAVAPGMGLNAYFASIVVGFHGNGPVSYEMALTAIFVEGFIFVGLSIFGLRRWLTTIIPSTCKLAAGVGIGLYLGIVGFTYNAGLGIVVGGGGLNAKGLPNNDNLLLLAGCAQNLLVDGQCPRSEIMRSGRMWLGIFLGGILPAIGLLYQSRFAIIGGIILVSIISWPRFTPVTYFTNDIGGNQRYDIFRKGIGSFQLTETFNALDWHITESPGQFLLTLITFLYVDLLDCTGTLYSMARFAGAMDEEANDFHGSAMAYIVDATGISIGALFGLSPVTAYIESGTGISVGGKTGITAITTGICFLLAVPFAPVFASIPPWATGGTLIVIGAMMASAAKHINWRYAGEAFPAFVTFATMPFTSSIAYGLIAGIFAYILINVPVWVVIKCFGVIPKDYEGGETWTWRVQGGIIPQWMRRACKGQKDFWRDPNIQMEPLSPTNQPLNNLLTPVLDLTQPQSTYAPGRFTVDRDGNPRYPGHMRRGYYERDTPELGHPGSSDNTGGSKKQPNVHFMEHTGGHSSGRNTPEEDRIEPVVDGHQRYAPSSGQYAVDGDRVSLPSIYFSDGDSDTSGSRRYASSSDYEPPFIYDERQYPRARPDTPEEAGIAPADYYIHRDYADSSSSGRYTSSEDNRPLFIYDEREHSSADRYTPEEDRFTYGGRDYVREPSVTQTI